MIIGITGCIGFGRRKIVIKIKRYAQYKLISLDCQDIAKYLITRPGSCQTQIFTELKDDIKFRKNGEIDLLALRNKMIADKEFSKKFMDIVQPYISSYIEQQKKKTPNYLMLLTSSHLFDYDYADKCDRIIFVKRNYDWRIENLRKERHITHKKYQEILSRCKSEEYMESHADWVLTETRGQIVNRSLKNMVAELTKFKEFVDNGLIPIK